MLKKKMKITERRLYIYLDIVNVKTTTKSNLSLFCNKTIIYKSISTSIITPYFNMDLFKLSGMGSFKPLTITGIISITEKLLTLAWYFAVAYIPIPSCICR